MKKKKILWIVIGMIVLVILSLFIGFCIYESTLPGTWQGRKEAIALVKKDIVKYGKKENDYTYKIEDVREERHYTVRLYQNKKNTGLYYYIDVKKKTAVFVYEPSSK